MKKTFLSVIAIVLVACLSFVSCQKTTELTGSPASLEQKLAKDQVLTDAINAAKDLYLKTSGGTLNDANSLTELQAIIAKVNNKTATSADLTKAATILGMPYESFIKEIQEFGVALGKVNENIRNYQK
ncbi:MAG: hypothetical protein R2807_03120 [Chitinophagales bacterium]